MNFNLLQVVCLFLVLCSASGGLAAGWSNLNWDETPTRFLARRGGLDKGPCGDNCFADPANKKGCKKDCLGTCYECATNS